MASTLNKTVPGFGPIEKVRFTFTDTVLADANDTLTVAEPFMRSLSFTMNGTTQSASFIDLGYGSGLYCNLYGVQGTADNNALFADCVACYFQRLNSLTALPPSTRLRRCSLIGASAV